MSTLARTLEVVDILQKHDFSKEEAQKVIDIMQGVSATKEDLTKAENRLDKQIISVKEDLLKTETKLDKQIASVREDLLKTEARLKEDIHALDKKIDFLQADFKWVKATSVGILLVLFGQILAMVFSLK